MSFSELGGTFGEWLFSIGAERIDRDEWVVPIPALARPTGGDVDNANHTGLLAESCRYTTSELRRLFWTKWRRDQGLLNEGEGDFNVAPRNGGHRDAGD